MILLSLKKIDHYSLNLNLIISHDLTDIF